MLVVPHHMERVLADIDANHGDCSIELCRHGVLLGFGPPRQPLWRRGQEHGRTIPLPDISLALEETEIPQCTASARYSVDECGKADLDSYPFLPWAEFLFDFRARAIRGMRV